MLAKILAVLISVPLIYLAIALGLILSQWPSSLSPRPGGLNFTGVLSRGDWVPAAPVPVAMRDGYPLPVRKYGEAGKGPLLVMLHGSGWHGLQFDGLAHGLADLGHVLVPDLRGHGVAPERRGDVDYIGQFEADLADLIDAARQDGQEVVLLGHSSGGGLVIRMAGGAYRDRFDRAVLLAPFIHHMAPTLRENSGGWTAPLTRRLIGLSMLNAVGVTALNHLTAIQFHMPEAVLDGPLGATATTAYSYRLNTGFAPRNAYTADLAALPPFLLIAGEEDEAFHADRYEPLLRAHAAEGSYRLIGGVGHLDVVDHPETLEAMRAFLNP